MWSQLLWSAFWQWCHRPYAQLKHWNAKAMTSRYKFWARYKVLKHGGHIYFWSFPLRNFKEFKQLLNPGEILILHKGQGTLRSLDQQKHQNAHACRSIVHYTFVKKGVQNFVPGCLKLVFLPKEFLSRCRCFKGVEMITLRYTKIAMEISLPTMTIHLLSWWILWCHVRLPRGRQETTKELGTCARTLELWNWEVSSLLWLLKS